jgi:Asp-tRNA(Asn)/Glu-tRNA(Gln) amidotransferase A subunit family amidase
MPARQLREQFEARALSPVEVMSDLLERCERLGPVLNPFITVGGDDALDAARAAEQAIVDGRPLGPLHGVPLSIKDSFWTAGMRTTYGSTLYSDFVPAQDATFAERLRRAGAIVFAKANVPEFCSAHRTLNRLTRECVTPWDPALTRSSGGSSGGSAVAVAAGLGPVSIGSDGGGSIRLPSALNGVVGFAASRGRVPVGPRTYHSPMQLVGPIARDVRDAAVVAGVLAGTGAAAVGADDDQALDTDIAGLRIAWTSDFGFLEPIRAEVVDTIRGAADELAACGALVDDPGLRLANPLDPFDDVPVVPFTVPDIVEDPFTDGLPSLDELLVELRGEPARWAQLTPYVRAMAGGNIDHPTLLEYAMSIGPEVRRRTGSSLQEVFERFDLIAAPTISTTAFAANDPAVTWQSYTAYTVLVNFVGCAAISVPAGFVDRLPVGLQLIAPPEREALLFRAARALERARPWSPHRPPVA